MFINKSSSDLSSKMTSNSTFSSLLEAFMSECPSSASKLLEQIWEDQALESTIVTSSDSGSGSGGKGSLNRKLKMAAVPVCVVVTGLIDVKMTKSIIRESGGGVLAAILVFTMGMKILFPVCLGVTFEIIDKITGKHVDTLIGLRTKSFDELLPLQKYLMGLVSTPSY